MMVLKASLPIVSAVVRVVGLVEEEFARMSMGVCSWSRSTLVEDGCVFGIV